MEKVENMNNRIAVNGAELYYERAGTAAEKPVLVFDSGYGWSLANWEPIRKQLEGHSELFFYDRAGIGKSSKSAGPHHSRQNAQNLRELLQKAEIKPPFVLVGHSFGGVNVRLFAQLYPEETAGIVLLDACHEEQNRKMVPLFTEEVRNEYLGQFTVEASFEEFEQSLEQVGGSGLGDTPLLVVTGAKQPHHTAASMREWLGFQAELAGLSANSRHLVLGEAGHAVHIDQPAAVVEAIQKWMETCYSRFSKKPC